jgi:hypothetical protein
MSSLGHGPVLAASCDFGLSSPITFALPLLEKTQLLDLAADFFILQGALALEVELPSSTGVP